MKSTVSLSWQRFVSVVLLASVTLFASAAFADPVIRFVKITAAGPEQQQEMSKLRADATKVYTAAKGCKWVKFWNDPSSGEQGSISLWDSEADVKAFLQSAEYKPILERLKPLVKGEVTSKIYNVEEPK